MVSSDDNIEDEVDGDVDVDDVQDDLETNLKNLKKELKLCQESKSKLENEYNKCEKELKNKTEEVEVL